MGSCRFGIGTGEPLNKINIFQARNSQMSVVLRDTGHNWVLSVDWCLGFKLTVECELGGLWNEVNWV